MSLTLNSSDIIALTALAVSALAAWKTIRFNERQKSLIESQERLNNLLFEKEESAATSAKRADLGVTIVKSGSSNYRLKIWNKGKSCARQVSISFPDGNDLVPDREIAEKLPLERLEPFQSVDLIAAIHMRTKRKHTVELSWSDDAGAENKKLAYATF